MNMAGEAPTVLAMWAMMAAMMVPAAAPAVVRIAGAPPGGRAAKALAFAVVYFGVWAAFGAAAALLQIGLESEDLCSEDMALRSSAAAGLSLVAIGLYQLSPLKRACLRLCRSAEISPMRYSLACLGSSWALMGVLFVFGVMNMVWMAALALWVLAEKALPWGGRLATAAGIALIAWGGVTFARST